MSGDLKPVVDRGSMLYRVAKKQNNAVLLMTLAPLILAVTCTLAILRWGATLPVIAVTFLLWCPAIIGYYLYVTRSKDVFRHAFAKKFLASADSWQLVARFDLETQEPPRDRFGNGFITRSFVVADLPFSFKWAQVNEIVWVYLGHSKIPGLNPCHINVFMAGGDKLKISGGNAEAAERFYQAVKDAAPFARFEDTQETRDLWLVDRMTLVREAASRRERFSSPGRMVEAPVATMTASLESAPGTGEPFSGPDKKTVDLQSSTPVELSQDVARIVGRLERINVLVRDKDEEFQKQISNLTGSLDRADFQRSADIIDLMGDTMNSDAVNMLMTLLDSPEESVKAHASLTLGKLGERSAVEPLISLLDDNSVLVKENAAVALGMIGDYRAEIPLRTIAAGNVRVKRAAVKALGQIEKRK